MTAPNAKSDGCKLKCQSPDINTEPYKPFLRGTKTPLETIKNILFIHRYLITIRYLQGIHTIECRLYLQY